jgi:hypothetical protein
MRITKIKVKHVRRWLPLIEQLDQLHKPFKLGDIETPDKLLDFITFGQRMELDDLIQVTDQYRLMIELVKLMYGLTPKQIINLPIIQVYPFCTWVLKEYFDLLKLEGEKYKINPTKEQKQAQIDRLNVFGWLPIIDDCMTCYKLSREDVEAMPYDFIFVRQWRNIEQIKYDRRLNAILYPETQ